jgi:hypothetical protein
MVDDSQQVSSARVASRHSNAAHSTPGAHTIMHHMYTQQLSIRTCQRTCTTPKASPPSSASAARLKDQLKGCMVHSDKCFLAPLPHKTLPPMEIHQWTCSQNVALARYNTAVLPKPRGPNSVLGKTAIPHYMHVTRRFWEERSIWFITGRYSLETGARRGSDEAVAVRVPGKDGKGENCPGARRHRWVKA